MGTEVKTAPVDGGDALAGLDALDTPAERLPGIGQRTWAGLWPKLAAIAAVVIGWQLVVWSEWRPDYLLPGPAKVGSTLWDLIGDRTFWNAVSVTMQRAALGFFLALLIGGVIGSLVSSSDLLRRAIGSLITGLQTMPSIAWFPLAILLFQLTEGAILFVVILGAAPSIANGVITGIDSIAPLLNRAADVLGAKGIRRYRTVILPAAAPSIIGGLKQGWAFCWRSLVAGELLVIVAKRPSLGARLQFAREFSDAPGVLALMVVFLIIGLIVDTIFSRIDRAIRARHGMI